MKPVRVDDRSLLVQVRARTAAHRRTASVADRIRERMGRRAP